MGEQGLRSAIGCMHNGVETTAVIAPAYKLARYAIAVSARLAHRSSTASNAPMSLTTNLYRSGNTTSPRFDNVREGKDIQVDKDGNVHPSKYPLYPSAHR